MSFDRVRWIELPKVADKRGNLSFIESARHIPFEIARTYWLYDVPGIATATLSKNRRSLSWPCRAASISC